MLVSIIIDSYNHAEYVGQAIDSALAQTYTPIEVIVVDDGSTDDSRSVIARYGKRVRAIHKPNGGQQSALNAGVAASRGEILCFLDGDDFFYPNKVEAILHPFRQASRAGKPLLVHHLLELLDETGLVNPAGRRLGWLHPSPLNLYDRAAKYKWLKPGGGPTSAISLNRALAAMIFPLPEEKVRLFADLFIAMPASLIAEMHALDEVLGSYRVHARSRWYGLMQPLGPEYWEALERFANDKLERSGRRPVLSHGASMFVCEELMSEGRLAYALWRMAGFLARQRDAETARYFLGVLRYQAAYRARAMLGPRRYAAWRARLRGRPSGAHSRSRSDIATHCPNE